MELIPLSCTNLFITVCNEVAKVMFLHVCVCPWRGLLWEVPAPRGACSGGCLVWRCLVLGGPAPGGSAPRGCLVPGRCLVLGELVSQHALRQTPSPQERRLLLRTLRILLECILVVQKKTFA